MFELQTFKKLVLPIRVDCVYTACFCEENVWKLCEYVKDTQPNILPYCYVAFISNKNQSVPLWNQCSGKTEDGLTVWVPLWNQCSGKTEDGLTVWDYHVIFIHIPCDNSEALVYDLDSLLPFPTLFSVYCVETFRSDDILKPEYQRMFRLVSAETFLKNFASDRSRMIAPDGTWLKPPPPYPPIDIPGVTNNLEDFISMDPSVGFGEVLSLKRFQERFKAN